MIDSETTETLATIVSDDSSEEEDSVTKVHKVTFRNKQKKILNTPTGASTINQRVTILPKWDQNKKIRK